MPSILAKTLAVCQAIFPSWGVPEGGAKDHVGFMDG